ncbi:DUF748 domain-containing protein [Fundidesulfovibrio agrisoli]|uniref:DUF748 domain-containing protein n=1 Tax=Fundidesulfovibrio agrisoli TaxID=2922717 RepID=UPI001FADC983|nr:DUF748 domain-containing protein [Fundidesulfovibrio agrisoli]
MNDEPKPSDAPESDVRPSPAPSSPEPPLPGLGPEVYSIARALGVGALWCAYGVVLVLFLGSVALPLLFKGYLEKEASAALDREIRLASMSVNPFTGRVRLGGFSLASKKGGEPLASFDLLDLQVGPLSLARGRFLVRGLHLENPRVRLGRDAEGRLNIADLLPEASGEEASRGNPLEFTIPEMSFSVSDVSITGGTLVFEDELKGTRHQVDDLRFTLDSYSSGQSGLREAFSTEGLVNGSDVLLNVRADLYSDPPQAEARLSVKNLSMKRYSPYLPLKRPMDLSVADAGLRVRAVFGAAGRLEGEAKLSGVGLTADEENFLRLDTIEVQGVSLDPAVGSLEAERLLLGAPVLGLSRDEQGRVGLLGALELAHQEETQAVSAREAGGAPPGFKLAGAELRDGRVEIRDAGLGLTVTLQDLRAALAGLDAQAGKVESVRLEAGSNLFERVQVKAGGAYLPLDLSGELTLEGLDFGKQLPTLRRLMPKLTLAGVAGNRTTFTLKDAGGQLAGTLSASLDVSGLRAQAEGQGAPLLQAKTLKIAGLDVDLAARRVAVGQVALGGGTAALTRAADGRFPALAALAVQAPAAQQAAPQQAAPPAPQTPAQPWRVSAGQLHITDMAAAWQDDQAKMSLAVNLADFSLKDVGAGVDKPVGFAAKGTLDTKAAFDVSGELTGVGTSGVSDTLGISAKLGLSGVDLAQAARFVPGLPVAVLAGQAGAEGSLKASLGKGGVTASYAGGASVAGLSLAQPGQTDPWLTLAGLNASGIAFQLSPPDFKAESITLDSPVLQLALDKDGKPVLPFAAQTQTQAQAQPQGKAPAPDKGAAPKASGALPGYDVASFLMRGGSVTLSPQGFDPPLSLTVKDIQVGLKGLKPGERAAVDASAQIGHSGKLRAQGNAGWTGSGPPVLDMKSTLDGLDLGELSPVSRKYTGFPITRGKLGLNLDYKIDAKALDLKNKIVVSGLQLGRKTPEPGQKDIPLDLAVSLLTDSKGVIDLDIPVKGAPETAKADLRDVISTAMAGAFAKVLFSPLAFLNVAGSSGSTAYAPFAPGTDQLTPEARKTLLSLGGALAGRPRLNVEIMTYVDPPTEAAAYGESLAQAQAQAKAQTAQPAQPAAEKGGKPAKGAKAQAPAQAPQPASESGQAAQPARAPSAEDWANLARKRMEVVWLLLTSEAKLPGERIYPVTGEATKPPKVQGQPGSRAEVRLRN